MTIQDPLNRRELLKQSARLAAGPVVYAVAAQAPAVAAPTRGQRISYYCDGEIHVTEVGKPEGVPITKGHWDFKPSWSRTEDRLVCFRRLKDDPEVARWKTAIFVIHTDGTGFHLLTDGTHTDFNPTWSRDGRNTPVWNRKNERTGGYFVMRGRVGDQPGKEVALTDVGFHTWAHSCLADGRILVNAAHPELGWGVYLLSGHDGGRRRYEPVECGVGKKGQLHRASISPSEKKICFEFMPGSAFKEPGHTLYVADFDAEKRSITNPQAIANEAAQPFWYAYPRWIEDEAAVVYHLNRSGKGELFVYRLEDGSTRRVSTNAGADYRYPHGEAAPC